MANELTRRDFLQTSVAAAAVGIPSLSLAMAHGRRSSGRLRVGVVGCGGRGSGAAVNILEASNDTQLVALGDMFPDRTAGCREELAKLDSPLAARASVSEDMVFHGFDAYQKVIAAGIDIVILASPPGFRPAHFAAAVAAGKHVFMEKPVCVDPVGARIVIETARSAAAKKLTVVAGTQRRHERCYHEAKKRVEDGAIGKVISASVYWNQGGLWNNGRKIEWSDMEWQIRNWLYFAWLSGDHIVEQHVHNLDVAYWFLGDLPASAMGLGGRQVRTQAAYGNAFDHFAIEYEYTDGRKINSYSRQIDGTSSRVDEVIYGTEGHLKLSQFGHAEIFGKNAWKWKGEQVNPYVQEHKDLLASILGESSYVNHGERIAQSTMLAVMGRMSAYTGKTLSWDQAMRSKLDLTPPKLELGSLPVADVAIPGKTPVV